MSAVGSSADNALAESFNATCKPCPRFRVKALVRMTRGSGHTHAAAARYVGVSPSTANTHATRGSPPLRALLADALVLLLSSFCLKTLGLFEGGTELVGLGNGHPVPIVHARHLA